ncbi:hypothetical protein K9M48_04005, partial [Candidatus Gracilibacteria bacterium]|nr:hypothetical protein [Candidatus Gracilibacteria bacterium]
GLIEVLASAPTIYQGNSNSFTGTAGFQTWTNLSSTTAILSKTSAQGTVGELGIDNVTLRVLVPSNQEVGSYQSTITIVVPTM